jgi:Zn-dependent protease
MSLEQISAIAVAVLFAITLHEAAHGWAAWKLGDDTAKRLGRVSFNPLRHIDLMGTIIVPGLLIFAGGILFGWAKPVPVNFARLRQPRRDMVLVAIAGPATNIILLVVSGAAFHIVDLLPVEAQRWASTFLFFSMFINSLLAIFNMMPLPPLDGGRVAVGLLPRGPALALARLERYGLFILLGLIFGLPYIGRVIGVRLDIFSWLIGDPARALMRTVLGLLGLELDGG